MGKAGRTVGFSPTRRPGRRAYLAVMSIGSGLPSWQAFAFRGTWHGPALALASQDNSFTDVFTTTGLIRHVTSSADAGTANVVLTPRSARAFGSACRALASGRR
jgi:hypothetical protein